MLIAAQSYQSMEKFPSIKLYSRGVLMITTEQCGDTGYALSHDVEAILHRFSGRKTLLNHATNNGLI
jgi:hypothetical protein